MTSSSRTLARDPFRFADYEGLVVATGLSAGNLREFLDLLRRVPVEVVHHHLFRSALSHRYGPWDHPNDFAAWASRSLGDHALAERLSSLELFRRGDAEDTRAAVIEIVEEHLDGLVTIPWARAGLEFHFSRGRFFAFPSGREAWTVPELADGIAQIPLTSLYYHYHEARLRGDDDEDDFSRWIEDEFGPSESVEQLRRLDFYLFSLEELRGRLMSLLPGSAAGARP